VVTSSSFKKTVTCLGYVSRNDSHLATVDATQVDDKGNGKGLLGKND
jgi:hypothetical protein